MKHVLISLVMAATAALATTPIDTSADREITVDGFVEMTCTARWGTLGYQYHTGYGATCGIACAQAMQYCYNSAGPYNARYCVIGSCYASHR